MENYTTFTKQTSDNCTVGNSTLINTHFSDLTLYMVIVGIMIIFFIGVIGNILVIYVIATEKALQTTANILFLNLAIADLLYLCIWIPITFLDSLIALGLLEKANTDLSCKLMNYVQNTSPGVSAFCLVSICVFRCVAIRSPLQANRRLTKRTAILTCIGIWCTLLLTNVPCLLMFVLDPRTSRCTARIRTMSDVYIIDAVTIGFDFFLPTVLFFLSSASTVSSMRRRLTQTTARGGDAALQTTIQQTRKVIRLVIIVFSLYFLCCAPLYISVILAQTGFLRKNVPRNARAVMFPAFLLLMCCNSAINPIVYNFASREFRKAFRRVVRRWTSPCQTRPERDSSSRLTQHTWDMEMEDAGNKDKKHSTQQTIDGQQPLM